MVRKLWPCCGHLHRYPLLSTGITAINLRRVRYKTGLMVTACDAESRLAKARVAGSNPVFRSISLPGKGALTSPRPESLGYGL